MSDTRIDEIVDSIFRLSTPVVIPGGAFSFNQACMHGSAYRGDGAALLRALAVSLDA